MFGGFLKGRIRGVETRRKRVAGDKAEEGCHVVVPPQRSRWLVWIVPFTPERKKIGIGAQFKKSSELVFQPQVHPTAFYSTHALVIDVPSSS